MGQVNLDQLDAIKERDSSAEEEEEREEDGTVMEEEMIEESRDEELEEEEEGGVAEKPFPKGKQESLSCVHQAPKQKKTD